MLATARREYDQQQRLTALAVAEAERLATRGPLVVARSVQTYQAAAVSLSLASLGALLAEQGIDTAQDATVAPAALLTPVRAAAEMLARTDSPGALVRLVQTMVSDAARTARAVDGRTRPAVTGYVRSLNLPSCGRCAVLAGRVYRYSEGFRRHPKCDCLMTPTTEAIGRNLITDPQEAFDKGQIGSHRKMPDGSRRFVPGLSKADAEAIRMGADIGQVVNVRRKAAGLTVGSSVTARAGRLTPQGCLSLASDRADALRLLRQFGYIT